MTSKRKRSRPAHLRAAINPHAVADRRTADAPTAAELGVIEVDDPYEAGATLLMFRNLRGDPLAAMHHAGQIDEAQYAGGRRWQRSFDTALRGATSAVDPTREAVDGGRRPDTLSDARCRALEDLQRASRVLGHEGESVVTAILGRGLTLAAAAAARDCTSEAERKYLGKRFRECLDTLAVEFGYATRRR